MQGRREWIKRWLALTSAPALAGLVSGCESLQASQIKGEAKTEVKSSSKSGQTGVVLDRLFFEHTQEDHPENAQRLVAIEKELQRRQLWEALTPVGGRFASLDELRWAHSQGYIDEIAALSEFGGGDYNPYLGDTYLNSASYDAARMAAGSAIELNLAVYDRQVKNGFALLRPPGHHALESKAMGFCLFNSDVIAARALQKYRNVKRVAILDFDVHHGNGTQDLTINDPSILALSVHQHPFWPMTGAKEWVGEGEAAGTNMNCPLPEGAGNQAYLNVFKEVMVPKLNTFQPDQLIVFAGYDAHWQDPLADHRMTVAGFAELVQEIKTWTESHCQGRLALSLGGGYKLSPLAHSVANSMEVLLNRPASADVVGESPQTENPCSKEIADLKKWFHS